MNSRERCIRSIRREELDRIPLVFRCRPEPFKALMEKFRLSSAEDLYKVLRIDIRSTGIGIKGGYLPKDVEVKEGPYGPAYTIGEHTRFEVRRDIWGVESIWAPNRTYTYTYFKHPLQKIPLEEYTWPVVSVEDFDAVLRARKSYENYCLCGSICHMWEIAWQLVGFKEIMRLMFTKPIYVEAVLNGLHKIRMEQTRLLCEAGVDVIYDGDDVGMQKGMMMSPGMWRRFLKPRYKELADLCHRFGVFFHFHSDGWIEPIIPDLIEIGVDILNPVQPECMDPAKLKRLYGDRLCFDGTIGVQSTLPFGTPEDVAREVKERIVELGPTGLILGPTHAIQPDTPIENILALYEAALKYGTFRQRPL